jgi:hypothetical protein
MSKAGPSFEKVVLVDEDEPCYLMRVKEVHLWPLQGYQEVCRHLSDPWHRYVTTDRFESANMIFWVGLDFYLAALARVPP